MTHKKSAEEKEGRSASPEVTALSYGIYMLERLTQVGFLHVVYTQCTESARATKWQT